jgi:predicted amidohydrolase YtcJ
MKRIAEIARKIDYQMNVHAIGDSTNRLVLDLIAETNKLKKDHRWRIEHAQVLSMEDIRRFAETGAFPSVQPTHAVSDQRWAENRLGKNRLKGAYAYNQLLKQAGLMALGTDFPGESIDPFLTIHAAVHRKNKENFPTDGFLSEDKISWEDCMRGMTIWAAFASFQEDEMGSLEKNKSATFVILNQPIQRSCDFQPNYAAYTFINGKKVYSFE